MNWSAWSVGPGDLKIIALLSGRDNFANRVDILSPPPSCGPYGLQMGWIRIPFLFVGSAAGECGCLWMMNVARIDGASSTSTLGIRTIVEFMPRNINFLFFAYSNFTTVCPRSRGPFYIESYHINWVFLDIQYILKGEFNKCSSKVQSHNHSKKAQSVHMYTFFLYI